MSVGKIDVLFEQLVAKDGSDLFLAPGHPALARVRGELTPLDERPIEPKDVEALLSEVLTPDQRALLAEERELTFAVAREGGPARFRANVLPCHGGARAAFHVVPSRVPTLAE